MCVHLICYYTTVYHIAPRRWFEDVEQVFMIFATQTWRYLGLKRNNGTFVVARGASRKTLSSYDLSSSSRNNYDWSCHIHQIAIEFHRNK